MNDIVMQLHKLTGCPISECKAAMELAIDYLRSLSKVSGSCDSKNKDEKDPNNLCPCGCGGEVKLSKIVKSSGMDGCYEDWEIFCPKCGGSWYWPADDFYGRDFYTKERVIELWNLKK